jgi:putative component of membrane protein insertase Oxa1/YidC/SpoIIIJ protein YidD
MAIPQVNFQPGIILPQVVAPVATRSNIIPLFGCGAADQFDNAKGPRKVVIDAEKPGDEELGALQRWCLKAIAWYQKKTRFIDEKDGEQKNKLRCVCPYNPSCSTYTAEAIRINGAVLGVFIGGIRVLGKCNPIAIWYKTGKMDPGAGTIQDPVPNFRKDGFWNGLKQIFGGSKQKPAAA